MNRVLRLMMTSLLVAGLCGLAAAALVLTALAQESETTERQPGSVSRTHERRLVGTIESIDKESRDVTLAAENGEKETFRVPTTMEGFSRLKVGDRVDVTYKESVALSVGLPGEKAGIQTRQGVTEQPAAEGRAGARVNEVTATAEIVSVDPGRHEITFKGPQGNIRTVTVEDAQLRRKMKDLKPGDTLQLVYTEAIAGSIKPAKKP